MLPAYGAMETNEQSPIYRYAKRAYFIIDKTERSVHKVFDNPLDLLSPDEVLKTVKETAS
jgi:peroxiredoxin